MVLDTNLFTSDSIQFGEGWVWHSRPESSTQEFGFWGRILKRIKLSHSFRYPIFNLLVPIHSEAAVDYLNQRKGLSISAKNYLNAEAGGLKSKAFEFLQTQFEYSCDQFWLQTLPAVLGYVFNPVSFWYCFKNKKLDAVVCEVNNTFGDRHFYFVKASNFEGAKEAAKRFHVSPFMDISGHYTFEFKNLKDGNQVRICLLDQRNKIKLDTLIQLRYKDLKEVTLFSILKKYGWLTVLVVWRIHFQALKLWLKGAKFYRRPIPPQERMTYDSKFNH